MSSLCNFVQYDEMDSHGDSSAMGLEAQPRAKSLVCTSRKNLLHHLSESVKCEDAQMLSVMAHLTIDYQAKVPSNWKWCMASATQHDRATCHQEFPEAAVAPLLNWKKGQTSRAKKYFTPNIALALE